MLPFRIHRPGKRHRFSIGVDSDLRVHQAWFTIELFLNLVRDLGGRQAARRWRLCVWRHLLLGPALRESWGQQTMIFPNFTAHTNFSTSNSSAAVQATIFGTVYADAGYSELGSGHNLGVTITKP